MIYTNPIELKMIAELHRERYPLMTEEDIVKLIYQGQLGGGYPVSSPEEALRLLQKEMEELKPDENEALIEIVSREWFRLNLRPAKAKGIKAEDIALMLWESTKKPVTTSKVRIYYRCIKLEDSARMREAAFMVVDEDCPPHHSAQYWNAYRPAYRVLHRDFRKRIKDLIMISCENREAGSPEDLDDRLTFEGFHNWYRSSGAFRLN